MASKNIFVDQNFNLQSLLNVKLNPLTSTQRTALVLTTADVGYVTYDTTLLQLAVWAGSAWVFYRNGAVSQVFTSGTGIWTKPFGSYQVATIYMIGGGSGGGSGRMGASATARFGGGGGSGGAATIIQVPFVVLPASLSYTVGAAGLGGAAVTTSDTNGINGSNGGFTIFGDYRARSGTAGGGGTTTAGAGGGGALGMINNAINGGAATGTTGGAGTNSFFSGSGGAGGSITAANTAGVGGTGSIMAIDNRSTVAGGAINSTTANLLNGFSGLVESFIGGQGGSGSGAGTTVASQPGGNGGIYGAGGGGSGASVNGFSTGKGGDGSPGIIIVVCS